MTFLSKNALADAKLCPLWLDDAARPGPLDSLSGDLRVDLLIVGGGFTGLWAAIQAKEADPSRAVALIEATEVAEGASGRPGGIISTSLMHGLKNASRIFPSDLDTLEALGRDNMDGFRASLDRYDIDAQAEWNGELTVSVDEAGEEVVEEEFQLHRQHGHDATLLNTEELQAEIMSPLFRTAVWNRKLSGTVNPARLAWGLKQAAIDNGVKIFEQTALLSLHAESGRRGKMRATTSTGNIVTDKIVLATNAFAAGHRKIRTRVVALRDRVLATEPLSPEQIRRVGWSNRQGIYDTKTQLNYMRLSKDNRIVFGGRMDYFFGNNTNPAKDSMHETYSRLAEAFFKTFPQLDDVRFSHAWSGPIALTTRMAVHFQRYFDDRVVWAGGYSGFGISTSRFGARIALGLLDDSGAPELEMEFARSMPNRIPPEPFRWIGAALTMHALDTVDAKRGWRILWMALVRKFGFPL